MSDEQQTGYNREEVIELAKSDMDMLAGLALPDVLTILFPPVFKALWQMLTEAAAKVGDFTQLAVGLPRGFGKTTVIKLFALFTILFSKKQFILIVGSTQTKAEAILADICFLLDEPNIKALFGDWQVEVEVNRQDLKKFKIAGKTMILACLGAGGDPRGLNIRFSRPDVIIMDDVQSRENALSKVQAASLRGWLFSTLLKTKSPTGCLFIYIGNMFASEDCILKELQHNPDWTSFIAGAILQDGESLWPELHTKANLLKELERDSRAGNAQIFFSELLNDSSTQSITGFDATKLLKLPPTYQYEQPQGKFIIIDPAGQSQEADPTVIALFELWDGLPWLRAVKRGSYSPKATIMEAISLGIEAQCSCIIVESVAYQASLLFWFQEIAKMEGIEGFDFLPINRSGGSKNAAIMVMLRQLQGYHDGKESVPPELGIHPDILSTVLVDIAAFNPQKRVNKDDLLDVLAYAPMAVVKYRAEIGKVINAAFDEPYSIVPYTKNCRI
jgi:hypothetical protein